MKLTNLTMLETFPNGSKVILICNQFFLNKDPKQYEAPLPLVQVQAHAAWLDITVKRHCDLDGNPGRQMMEVEKKRHPMHFDRYKCYLPIQKPQSSNYDWYEHLELTTPDMHKPTHHLCMSQVNGKLQK